MTAGNASQLSDGASACVVASGSVVERRGLEALGVFKGFAVGGCAPEVMGECQSSASGRAPTLLRSALTARPYSTSCASKCSPTQCLCLPCS